jgi:hypothetical protein
MEFGYDAILKIHPPKPLILGEWLYRMGFSCIKINTAVELHYAPPLVDRVWDLHKRIPYQDLKNRSFGKMVFSLKETIKPVHNPCQRGCL